MNQSIIELKHISKVFFTEKIETRALNDINMVVENGEFVSISGPSGCGKSTLLSLIGLLDSPSSGKYTLKGENVADLISADRAQIRNQQIGFVFQHFNLIGDLTVFENVALPLAYRGITRKERKVRAEEVLEHVQMSHRREHFPNQLSGGQQQRVAVARALAGEPLILLADEPTGNLDSENAEKVMQLFTQLNEEGSTICMVTHNQAYDQYASRVIKLLDGNVVE